MGGRDRLTLHIHLCSVPVMATNLALDDRLIEAARRIGGHRSKKEAVTAALEEYVLRRRQLGILRLAESVPYDTDYDYKAERRKPRR